LEKGGQERKQSRIDLVGIQVNMGIHQNHRELLYAVRGITLQQFMSKELCVVIGNHLGSQKILGN